MLQTIISGLVLAAVSGLAFLAYKHPEGYEKLSKILIWATIGIFVLFVVFMFGYAQGVYHGSVKDKLDDWIALTAFVCLATVLFLACLTLLPLLTKEDRKNDAGKDEPPKPEHLSASAELPAAREPVRPAAPKATVSKSQPPITSVVLRSPAVNNAELDLAEYFAKYDLLELDGRFLERDKLKIETNGRRVFFLGVVHDVTDIYGKPRVMLSNPSVMLSNPFKCNTVFVEVGAPQFAEAYSLRKDDLLEARGIADTSLLSSITIGNASFTRMDKKQVIPAPQI